MEEVRLPCGGEHLEVSATNNWRQRGDEPREAQPSSQSSRHMTKLLGLARPPSCHVDTTE